MAHLSGLHSILVCHSIAVENHCVKILKAKKKIIKIIYSKEDIVFTHTKENIIIIMLNFYIDMKVRYVMLR